MIGFVKVAIHFYTRAVVVLHYFCVHVVRKPSEIYRNVSLLHL